jgi:hypothetical protein
MYVCIYMCTYIHTVILKTRKMIAAMQATVEHHRSIASFTIHICVDSSQLYVLEHHRSCHLERAQLKPYRLHVYVYV